MVRKNGLGDCEWRFRDAAAEDGLILTPAPSYDWIGMRGPFGLTAHSGDLFDRVMGMAVSLGGLIDVMQSPMRRSKATFDLIHVPSGVHIEVDEEQHFSSHRLTTLDWYPPGIRHGFDIEHYRMLCRRHGAKVDRSGFAHKSTPNFGPRSRVQQRAFYDAMKDMVLPAMGLPHVVRIDVPLRDPERAWVEHRERVFAAVDAAVS